MATDRDWTDQLDLPIVSKMYADKMTTRAYVTDQHQLPIIHVPTREAALVNLSNRKRPSVSWDNIFETKSCVLIFQTYKIISKNLLYHIYY